jgi:plasmid stabilization system protein ParE
MRAVRYAQFAESSLRALLAQGALKFGVDVADEKRLLLRSCVSTYLAEFPHHGLKTTGQTFRHYPVTDTPFTLVYDYDDAELRVLFIWSGAYPRLQSGSTYHPIPAALMPPSTMISVPVT